ncbi:MAG: hypothetical protein KDK24_03915 [Pseudooceanicola sp.]|nr:hypothetical protein [Pseudooceanicola sp.]
MLLLPALASLPGLALAHAALRSSDPAPGAVGDLEAATLSWKNGVATIAAPALPLEGRRTRTLRQMIDDFTNVTLSTGVDITP